MDLNNKVIKVLTRTHGKKVIQFFKDNGVDTEELAGRVCEADYEDRIYYGLIKGNFSNYSLDTVQLYDTAIIELPENEPIFWKEEKVMLVRDTVDNTPRKRVVFGKKNGKFLAWAHVETIEEAVRQCETSTWRLAEEIQQGNPKKKELLEKANELIKKAEELKAAANEM
jgi:hypothetical protein